MRTWLGAVDNYWFGKGTPTALGVFRIIVGILTLINLLIIASGFPDWFGEKSFVPLKAAELYNDNIGTRIGLFGLEKVLHIDPQLPGRAPRIDLLAGTSNPTLIAAFLGVVMLAAIFTAIGLWSKLSSIVLAVGVVSINHRNGLILNGGDTILRMCLLYLALSPCGLSCSVDRLIALWKGKIGPELPQVSLWAQKLIQYNVAVLYFMTFWLKFGQGDLWRNFTATYYASHLSEFRRFWLPEFVNQPPMVYFTSFATLAIELALATLVFYKPARKAVLISGLVLHASLEYSLNIPLFQFLVTAPYICFYAGDEVTGFFRRLGGNRFSRFKVNVPLPAGMKLAPGPANFFAAVDPFGLVTYVPGDSPELSHAAIKKSWTHSLGAWTVGWIPQLWRRLLSKALVSGESALTPKVVKGAKKLVTQ